MTSTSQSQSGTAARGWKAVVLYTDVISGAEAQKLLSRVAQLTDSGDAWQTSYWRFDVMSEQPVARLALKDAQDAQLVFLSARSISDPPLWLLEWLRAWAQQRRGRTSAVAAWCHHPSKEVRSHRMGPLRELAREQQLTFLCADDFAAPPSK
jgi:hypothetical protein